MMDRFPGLAGMLANRWMRGLSGAAVASALIWYVLPAVPAFRSPVLRLAAIAAILLIVLAVNALLGLRRRWRERALTSAMTGAADREDARGGNHSGERSGAETDADAAAERAELRERMASALAALGRGRRRPRLYDQPWYVLIGSPGAGKTTALMQSGLHFPLARDRDDPSVAGVGGTRLCDWWFAEEAVLVDTAGRYTTQDSDAALDRAGWRSFLDLLRRTRPRQPINGVIVVVSALDLLGADQAERRAQAHSIRRRIDEIGEQLRIRVPVYLVVSKADQLNGFDAFFADLDPTGRAQVWGMTFGIDEAIDAFAPGFRGLLQRLQDRLIERLQAERTAERRALIGGFPLQVASLEAPLAALLEDGFRGSRVDPAPWLRGVYLTSATQQGTPIDRLTGLLARDFGIDRAAVPALRPVSGRGYFLSSLVREVMLGEALLVRRRPKQARRRLIVRATAFALLGSVSLAGLAVLWHAHHVGRVAVERDDEAIAALRQSLATSTASGSISTDDLPTVTPTLDAAARLPDPPAGPLDSLPGLSQERKLRQVNRLAYQHTLERVLLPRLLWRLEQQMRASIANPDFLYEATRIYLMLGGAGPLDRDLVHSWMAADWAQRYPGTLNASLRNRLLSHLDALLSAPLPPVSLDGALVEAARATFSRVGLPARIYGRIQAEGSSRAVPDWVPASALGPLGMRLFVRPSGATLQEGVPGFFTGQGFRTGLLEPLPATARAVAQESWVLGRQETVPTDRAHLATLEQQVVALWAAGRQRAWDQVLGDLALAPFGNRHDTIQTLYILASPQSPIRDLLRSIAGALQPEPSTVENPQGHAPTNGSPALAASLIDSASAAEAPSPALDALASHDAPLLSLVAGNAPTPLDNILRLVNALQTELANEAGPSGALAGAGAGAGADDPAQLLLAEADRQPAPLSRWLRQIAQTGDTALGAAAHEAAQTSFSAQDGAGTLCRRVVSGHYPFEPSATSDASLDDFARLFAPGGALDLYVQNQLAPFIDRSGPVWRLHPNGDIAAPLDGTSLARFQQAARIRDAFFAAGGGAPQVRFTLSPSGASAGSQPELSLGGTRISADATDPVAFTWPVASGPDVASVRFGTAKDAAGIEEQGAWGLFRLLGRGHLQPDGTGERFTLSFTGGQNRAAFDLQAGSAANPFSHNLLAGFRCPIVQ